MKFSIYFLVGVTLIRTARTIRLDEYKPVFALKSSQVTRVIQESSSCLNMVVMLVGEILLFSCTW